MIPCCVFCGEKDPHKLTMSTRIVNGKAVTIDACFNCYWREKFMAGGEDGILSEREADREVLYDETEFSVRDASELQERDNFRR